MDLNHRLPVCETALSKSDLFDFIAEIHRIFVLTGILTSFISLSLIWNSRLKVSKAISEVMFELFDIGEQRECSLAESGGRYWTGPSTSNIH
jgi:hypothetical protein